MSSISTHAAKIPSSTMKGSAASKIVQLPRECMLEIFEFLDAKSVLASGCCCREWHAIVEANIIWEPRCRSTWDYFRAPKAPMIRNDLPPAKQQDHQKQQQQQQRQTTSDWTTRAGIWKQMYIRKSQAEQNWKRGHYFNMATSSESDSHGESVQSLQIVNIEPDACSVLLSTSWDSSLRLWNLSNIFEEEEGEEDEEEEDNDRRRSWTGSPRTRESKSFNYFRILEGHSEPILTFRTSLDGGCYRRGSLGCKRLIYTGSWDHTVRIWDMDAAMTMMMMETSRGDDGDDDDDDDDLDSSRSQPPLMTLVGHEDKVRCVQNSIDNRILVSTADDYDLRVWDVETGQCIRVLDEHLEAATGCLFLNNPNRSQHGNNYNSNNGSSSEEQPSPLDSLLVSISRDRTIKLWDLRSPYSIATIMAHNGGIYMIDVDYQHQRIATGAYDGSIKIWEPRANQSDPVYALRGHSARITCLRWSSPSYGGRDNNPELLQCLKARSTDMIVSGSKDLYVRVWDAATGALVKTLGWPDFSHSGIVTDVKFDNKRIVSSSYDTSVKVWNAANGELMHKISSDDVVSSVVFDEDWIVSGSDGGKIRVYQYLSPPR